jgi:hypothetical protein
VDKTETQSDSIEDRLVMQKDQVLLLKMLQDFRLGLLAVLKTGENCIVRNFIIRTLQQTMLG